MKKQERTLLIVDDCPEDRELYRRYLQRDVDYSYTLLEANLGCEGLKLWQEHQPDAVLLDYRLPDLDGLEFIQKIQPNLSQSLLPVIMVTGQGNEVIAVRAIKAGAYDYLIKEQITAEVLQVAVKGAFATMQLQKELQQRIEREKILSEIIRKIHQSLDLDEILQTTVTEVRKFLQCDRVLVIKLRPKGWATVTNESVAHPWTSLVSNSYYDLCLQDNYIDPFIQGLVTIKPDIYDGSVTPCHVDLLASLQVRANLVVPILQNQHNLWGMLIAHHCEGPRAWQTLEVDLLKDLATQLGIALQQAELYQQAQKELAERRQAEITLQESQALFEAFMGYVPGFAYIKDDQGRYLYVNSSTEKLWNLELADWLGKTDYELFPSEDVKQWRHNDLVALETNQAIEVEETYKQADYIQYFISYKFPIQASPYRRLLAGLSFDITDRKQAELKLNQQAAQLIELNKSLEETSFKLSQKNQDLDSFVYTVSHDLKAPLRGIFHLSQWIESDLQGQLSEENVHHLQMLRGRVNRMEAFINGLLAYARIGRTEVATEMIKVGDFMAEILEYLAPPSNFTIIVAPKMPNIFAKKILLFQVFFNLLSNGIKHNNNSQPRIEISATEKGQYYEFSVRDNGPGIAPENQERIFNIFQTIKGVNTPENTGIGLSIVKKIVETEGGAIALESSLGEGATFRLSWLKHPYVSVKDFYGENKAKFEPNWNDLDAKTQKKWQKSYDSWLKDNFGNK